MPWRLVGFVVIFAIFVAFITFNLGNTCDINYGPFEFTKLNDVPVFLTIFISFFVGMFAAIPFIIGAGKKRKQAAPGEEGAKPRKRWGKKKESPEPQPSPIDSPANVEEI
jgi:hypothetical protein